MKLRTCFGCLHDKKCEAQDVLRRSVKGLRITSLKHRCDTRTPMYQPGQPVNVHTYASYEDGAVRLVYPGYVVEQTERRVIAFVEPDTPDLTQGWPFEPNGGGIGYMSVPLARVHPDLNRPSADATICDLCGRNPGLGSDCPHGIDFKEGVAMCTVRQNERQSKEVGHE